MRFHRSERISSLIQRRIGWLIEKEIEIPGVLISVAGVETTEDLSQTKIGVTVYPSEKSKEAMDKLSKRARFLEFKVAREINIKPMPHIVFELDRGSEKAARIEKMLLEDNNKEN